ncbi:PREDICTED: agamous-like MADS-box protein AGL62 [Lupinus angustifolius]|uniref:agamous-like MADS-box protein AGL62 n=1 Tax=Lupinus angustifolius TaxID=3871 RepID=UPI00092EBD21|nr:PREDICTED: agamous-like MADS-box protein AGL62 [Lupinus angustifolius]
MRDQPQNLENMHFIEARRNANVQEINEKISNINEALKSEKKYSEELTKQRKEAQEHVWWAAPIEEMNGDQLDQFKLALKNLKKNVLGVVERQNIADVDVADVDADAVATIPPPHFFYWWPIFFKQPFAATTSAVSGVSTTTITTNTYASE